MRELEGARLQQLQERLQFRRLWQGTGGGGQLGVRARLWVRVRARVQPRVRARVRARVASTLLQQRVDGQG